MSNPLPGAGRAALRGAAAARIPRAFPKERATAPSACHARESETPASLGPRPHRRGQEASPTASPGPSRDRGRDCAARDTAGPRSPNLPSVPWGLLRGGTSLRAAASPPPRSRAGALEQWERPGEGSARARERPRRSSRAPSAPRSALPAAPPGSG